MNKKFGWVFLAFMLGLLAYAGFNAFLRDWPAEGTDALGNLVLGFVCSVLFVLCVRRIFKPRRRKTHTAQKAFEREELRSVPSSGCDPLLREAANFITNGGTADVSAIQRKLKVSYSRAFNILSQLEEIGIIEHLTERKADSTPSPDFIIPPRVEDLISVHFEHTDPDEGVETPAWAELSYLDVKALKFWGRKSTDFQIPDYYADTAFGRNVGPARDRLLEGGYLQLGDIRKSIELKTVPDLKEVLAGKELKTSGKKGELVQRLLDNIPPDELRDLFPVSPYEVTEKGREAFSQYEIIFENQDYGLGLSYYRILDAKSRNPEEEDAVILTKLISEDIEECYRTGNRTRYQEFLPKAARFMEGHGEDLAALELTILSYFVWTMEAKSIPASAAAEQNRYLARNVEDYARRCSLTFEQLTEHFVETVRKNKPFGMSSEANINYALSMLKSGLSIK